VSKRFGGFFPESQPIKVENGLRARTAKGAIGSSWWSKRFIGIMESFGMGSRLTRGRAYARKGQVVSLDIEPGLVSVVVQGSSPRPYSVRIAVVAFDDEQWAEIQEAMNQDQWFVASLLDGQMPEDIEPLFASLGLSLFPARQREMRMQCSCPDSAVPCKHLAAAFYILAERFDEDPFSILAWRGRTREELMGGLESDSEEGEELQETDGVPLEQSLDSFYSAGHYSQARVVPQGTGLLIDQVPVTGLKVGTKSVESVLRPIYRTLRGDQ